MPPSFICWTASAAVASRRMLATLGFMISLAVGMKVLLVSES
jgi:hypothetical protein